MRNLLFALVGLLAMAIAMPDTAALAAEGADAPRILVLDIQRVMDQSIMGKAARSDLQDELKKREGGLSIKRTEVERLKADLQKQAALLAGQALSEKQEAISKKERDLAQEFQAQREEMTRKTDAQMKRIIAQIDAVLAEMVQTHENSIVVEQDPRLVVYSDPRLDITEEVIKRLNEKKLNL